MVGSVVLRHVSPDFTLSFFFRGPMLQIEGISTLQGTRKDALASELVTVALSPRNSGGGHVLPGIRPQFLWTFTVDRRRAAQIVQLDTMSGTNTSPVGDDLDDFAGVYEPLSKDGAFVVYRPRAIEDLQEPFQPERTAPREKNTAVPPRVRRCISALRSEEAQLEGIALRFLVEILHQRPEC
eukprot:s61_g35.t1